ncbi:hypothetical protein SAMN04488012_103239 [Palleronia salina]|uniref:Uncharacterized protein n=1 Tax=Palleronia salina TaxID=313368 RepID=A0A1M6EW02_9RHOB|nr:hypothetical protein [Palleronia salina]SHI89588.1 hypothetical protein SAMN04488012_103239 [Palleronia salina]
MPRTTATHRHTTLRLVVWAQAVILAFVFLDLLVSDSADWLLREGGSIETVSAVLLAMAAVAHARLHDLRRDWHVPVGLLLLSLRELDADKAFTTEGILQSNLYTDPAPWPEKVIGGAVVLLALVVLYRLARYQLVPWLRGLWAGDGWAWTFTLAGVLVVVAKSLDGIARKLAPLGIDVSNDLARFSGRVEESFELIFALCLIAVVGLSRPRET